MKQYLEEHSPPEGATHCVNPESYCDPLFYRMRNEVLEIYGIAIEKWLPSKHDPEYIDTLWVLK